MWRRRARYAIGRRSSNLSDFVFVAIVLLLPIETTTIVPSRFASRWKERPSSYIGDHIRSEMAGAPPVICRARSTRTTPSKYVRTTLLCGAHSSSRTMVASIGRWARTTQTTHSEYVRTTLLFGAHSSSQLLVASVPRQTAIKATPQRNCPGPSHQTYLRRNLPACCTAHLRELPAQAPRSAIDLYFFMCLEALRRMLDKTRTSILKSTLRMTFDGDFAC